MLVTVPLGKRDAMSKPSWGGLLGQAILRNARSWHRSLMFLFPRSSVGIPWLCVAPTKLKTGQGLQRVNLKHIRNLSSRRTKVSEELRLKRRRKDRTLSPGARVSNWTPFLRVTVTIHFSGNKHISAAQTAINAGVAKYVRIGKPCNRKELFPVGLSCFPKQRVFHWPGFLPMAVVQRVFHSGHKSYSSPHSQPLQPLLQKFFGGNPRSFHRAPPQILTSFFLRSAGPRSRPQKRGGGLTTAGAPPPFGGGDTNKISCRVFKKMPGLNA